MKFGFLVILVLFITVVNVATAISVGGEGISIKHVKYEKVYGGKINPKLLDDLNSGGDLKSGLTTQTLSSKKQIKVLIYIDPVVFSNRNFKEVMLEIAEELSDGGIRVLDYDADPIVALISDTTQIDFLTSLSYVTYIEDANLPFRRPEVQSEGLQVLNVPDVWNVGFTGNGVKVGVLDLGFEGWDNLMNIGELPENTYLYSPNGIGSDSHGSACAEIVYDVAPGIDGLYLAYENDSLQDVFSAVKWFIENGVRVISHSVGWYSWCPSYFDSDGDGDPSFGIFTG